MLYDLRSSEIRKTALEVPANPLSVLPDGRILGVNEKQNALTVFDKEESVAARCTVPGSLRQAYTDNGRVCLAEVRGPDTHGLAYDALFDETSIHVWRLDPVPEKQL